MGQVTIYLDDEIEKKMRDAAAQAGLSQSQWVATIIKKKIQTEWPESFKSLAGQWKDFPSLEEIRGEYNTQEKRESI